MFSEDNTRGQAQWSQFFDLQESVDRLPLPKRSNSALWRRGSGSGRTRSRWQPDALDSPMDDGSEALRGNASCAATYDAVEELRARVPFLSSNFHCTDDDASLIISMLSTAAASSRGIQPNVEEKLMVVSAEKRMIEERLDRRNEDVERLKDELAEAKQKLRAVQQQAVNSSQLLSQKREEIRKQLLLEEGRTQKLQHENKLLTQEMDKLKSRLHHLLK
jgi:hypothetical protein